MASLFNQTFYDLNGKRAYCLHPAEVPDWFPADVLVDAKLSLPSLTDQLYLGSLFIKDEVVRLTFLVKKAGVFQLVAKFSSDSRRTLRLGDAYPLTSVVAEYGGWVVFGENVKVDFTRAHLPLLLSEECCTRYVPSAIPYAAMTCDSEQLIGEVGMSSGDPLRLVSECREIDDNDLKGRVLCLSLRDTEEADMSNPMIGLANGSNNYSNMADGSCAPIFKLFGAVPDENGQIQWVFDDPFYFTPVKNETNLLAVGSEFDIQEICDKMSVVYGGLSGIPLDPNCDVSKITLEELLYQ